MLDSDPTSRCLCFARGVSAAGGSLRVVTKPAVDGAPGSVGKPGGSQDAFPGEACPFENSLLHNAVSTCDGLDPLCWCGGEQVVTELPLGPPSDTTSLRFRQHCDANVPAVSASTVSYGLPGDLPGLLIIHSDERSSPSSLRYPSASNLRRSSPTSVNPGQSRPSTSRSVAILRSISRSASATDRRATQGTVIPRSCRTENQGRRGRRR